MWVGFMCCSLNYVTVQSGDTDVSGRKFCSPNRWLIDYQSERYHNPENRESLMDSCVLELGPEADQQRFLLVPIPCHEVPEVGIHGI
jgi:hypothetical protein